MKRNRWFMTVGLLTAAFTVAGCSDDENTIMAPVPEGEALVRVGHLSPDAPAVDVWVDGNVVLEDVPFKAFSGYLALAPGAHRIQVTPANAIDPVVIDAQVDLAEGVAYTVVARGLLAQIEASVLVDSRAVDGQNAKVRFVHASPDAPAVDITLTDGTILFGAVPFGESDDPISVPAGSYDLQVRAAGTETVVLSFDDVPLSAGTNYSVFAVGRLADGSLGAIVAVDSPGDGATTVELATATAEVRVAHLSPDAPNVDVYVDDVIVAALTNVPFEAVSGYLGLPARTTNVKVYVAGTMVNPVIDADLTFLPGTAYTVAATGLVGAGDLAPIVLVDDRAGAPAGSANVRFVHTSPDAPAVKIVAAGGPTIFTETEFRASAGYATVAAATYDLEVRLASNDALALSVPGVQLSGGTSYTIFAIGLAGNGSLAAKAVVDTP